ncbi:hypothetical protein SAMN05421636_1104 [Pricia antarctica]|uniref:Uncharacterized protein n=2 Tax=Pricia antarctica TaxID=641691 RepID=A0A1G7HQX6_9FLAO|nr:hypothetical protein SAMN05421636_1104 [Pricia antarctica]
MENIFQKAGYAGKYFAQKKGLGFNWKTTKRIIIENILLKTNYIRKYFAILLLI